MTENISKQVQNNFQSLEDIIQRLFRGKVSWQQQVNWANLELLLLDVASVNKQFSFEEIDRIWQQMPYWAFVWAAGEALAKYLLAHPDMVKNKTVLDWGAGSGVVGLVASKLGAKQVIFLDRDPYSLKAISENAKRNQLNDVLIIEDVHSIQTNNIQIDLVIGSDILYDATNTHLIGEIQSLGNAAIFAERNQLSLREGFVKTAELDAQTFPNPGNFDPVYQVSIWQSFK